jgi:hypothetical protein
MYGAAHCKGVNINAATLDWAVKMRLDEHLGRGEFLDRLFAAWQADEASAQGQVQLNQSALDEALAELANLTHYAARTPTDGAAGVALQLQLDQVNTLIPALEAKVVAAQGAVQTVRGSAALRDVLKT